MLVGICGQAGSGKSTVAQFLVRHHGFVELGLADAMKRFVQDAFDFSDEQIWGSSEHRNAPDERFVSRMEDHGDGGFTTHYLTPRFALQTLGTEWGRNCYPMVWVDYAIRIYKKLQEGNHAYDQKRGLYSVSFLMNSTKEEAGYDTIDHSPMIQPKTNVVISDVRFLNEVIGIRNAGGFVFRIKRPGAEGDVGIKGHASEAEQKAIHDDMLDGVILNSRDIDHLYDVINRVVVPYILISIERM